MYFPADVGRSSYITGVNVMPSGPATTASSTDSLPTTFDVEGLISRYSETLASQVLALVQRALPKN
jgi:hypothetical protein